MGKNHESHHSDRGGELPSVVAPSSGLVPLGTVIDWWYFDGLPIPDGYEVCDGTPVQDPGSPFHGARSPKPDLRNKFTMGVIPGQLGRTGGTDTIPFALGADSGPVHFTIRTTDAIIGGFDPKHCFQTQGDEAFNHTHAADLGGILAHDHGGNNLPPFVGLVKLIRVR